ncbi:MAG: hypothetical protein ACSLFF_04670 [Solirubrobacterales bacterium]
MTEPTLSSPNYFDFGRAEICQDAFIAWLASWADRRFEHRNPELHALGCEFVATLARLSGKVAPLPAEIRVECQREWLDVVIEVGDEMLIIVEDKVAGVGRKRQLDKHAFRAYGWKNRRSEAWREICMVYVKTYRGAPPGVLENPLWSVIDREALLGLLPPDHPSDLVREFRERLEVIDLESRDSFAVPVRSWSKERGWDRFESFVENELEKLGATDEWRELQRENTPHLWVWPRRGLRVCIWPRGDLYFDSARRELVSRARPAPDRALGILPFAFDARTTRTCVGLAQSKSSECGVAVDNLGVIDQETVKSDIQQLVDLLREPLLSSRHQCRS